MTVPRQLTHRVFDGGIDERQRAELVDPMAAFLVLENLRGIERGSAGKRYGFSALTLSRLDGTSRSAAYKAFADEDTAVVIDGTYADAYDTAAAKWLKAGRVCELGYRMTDLPSVGGSTNVSDVEVVNSHLAAVSLTSTSIVAGTTAYATVTDLASGATVSTPAVIRTSASDVVVGSFSSRYFVAAVGDGINGTVTAYILDTQAIGSGWTSLATVAATNFQAGRLSICSLSDRVAICYGIDTGTDRVVVKTYDQTGLKETATINSASTTPTDVCVAGSIADTLWIAWAEGVNNVNLKGLTGNNLAVVKATAATIVVTTGVTAEVQIAVSATTGKGRLIVNDATTTPSQIVFMRGFQTSAGAAATDGSLITVYGARLMGRPLTYAGRYYCLFYPGVNSSGSVAAQATAILCDCTDDVAYLRPVASPAPGLVTFGTTASKIVQGLTASKFYAGLTITRSQVATVGQLLELDFGDTRRWQAVRHGRSTFLTGAVLTYFDGVRVQEAGFVEKPTTPTTSLGGTGVTLANGRRYVCVYEDVDADGNWIVSGISDPCTQTAAPVNQTITVATAPLTISSRAAGPSARVAFYATLGSANGQPPYYRLGTTANTTAASTVTYADSTPDATLAVAAKLYAPNLPGTITSGTVGESLDRRAPPGLMHLESYNGMLVGAAGASLFHSGQPVDGEATWFSPIFQLPVEGAGEVTGLKAMDGTLFVFKRRSVFAVAGEIPSDTGTSGGLGTPRRLAVDVGCIDARSIVLTSKGIFFQAEGGAIYLLTRSQDVVFVGESVRRTTAAYPICTAATLDVSSNLVYFELAAAESLNQVSGSGRTLVLDLALTSSTSPYGTWVSTDRRKNQGGSSDAPAQGGAYVYNGSAWRYAWLGTDGRLYVEDRTTFLDPASAWVTQRAEFAWFKNAGLQGHQMVERALCLLRRATDHDLALYVAYDYDTSYKTPRTWTRAELATITAALPNEQLEHLLHDDNQCQAIRFKMEDASPTGGTVGTGQGATWLGLTIQGTTLDGAVPLPDMCR